MQIVYLASGQEPDLTGQCWIAIEADPNGCFCGTGAGLKPSGEAVFYASLAKDDVALESAIRAAELWAAAHGVGTIQVQPEPRC